MNVRPKPRRLLGVFLVTSSSALLCAVAPACSDPPTLLVCHDIPDGGCPLQDNACDDPACAAVYGCDHTNATWYLDHTCSAHPAVDGGPDAPAPVEAGLRDVEIDVPGASGGPGCADLEPPDCPLALAVACPSNSCCGCEDLYVCQGGGWNQWGTCGDGGVITPSP